MTELDNLDTLAAEVFDGYLVKKDLAQQFRGQYPVPTYVGEFMLGRYCATTDPDEIARGLEMVQQSMQDRTVRAGEEELFKHRAREKGRVKIIDLLRARLDSKSDAYKAELPSLQLNDIHISAELVDEHQRMLTGGFYAEVTLEYSAALAAQQGGQPFRVEAIRPIQMSTRDALATFLEGRSKFTLAQWRELLLRSVGFEPSRLSPRQQDVLLARMVPFVVRNYNAVELGPRGTGKSHLFQQVSPYAHLVSGGKATIANMFVNMNTGRRGLVAQYDVVCFDEVSGVSFDQKEGVNILKGYMESGEFSRGRESIRADGGIVMVGNFDVDVDTQLRVGHLLAPLPKEMRDDTAFMDRIHAYLPGWDVPKLDPSYFTEHFGFVSDYLAEVWTQLRHWSRLDVLQGRVEWGSQLSGRDRKAVNNTVDGLLRLLYPDPQQEVPDEFLAWASALALEMRRRVKEAQAFIGVAEFGKVDLSYRIGGGSETVIYCEESVRHRMRMEAERDSPASDGQTADGEVLPAPDAKDVSSRTPARDYVAGDTIGGRFEVEEVLGSGGFSKVYRVRDVVEGAERALKLFDNAAGYDAVRREINVLRKVHHPNVVQVIWADRTDQGEWYLIMEYIDGEILAEYATGKKQLRDREAIDVGLDVLGALIAIHPDSERLDALEAKKRDGEISAGEYDELMALSENALVHRDIKPQNIMLTRSGAKLLDFNIASRVGDPVHTVSGTPPYQPPDADLTRWDVSTDLFAVGVTLYELLCDGHHPYPQARPTLDMEPQDPRQFRKDMSEGLAHFLQRVCFGAHGAIQDRGRDEVDTRSRSVLSVTRSEGGPLVLVDLSNLCRDRRLLPLGLGADAAILDRFLEALDASDIAFRNVRFVSDRSLLPLVDSTGRRRLRELERHGSLEFSSMADERLLDLAFGEPTDTGLLVASMDGFDDFRRTYPSIQGSRDRFIGWAPAGDGVIRLELRDMGVHSHRRLSRKEESAELRARRLQRQSVVRRAAETYFRCDNGQCLLAQLWPGRLPEMPRYNDHSDRFVCPGCEQPLETGVPRLPAVQLIVFLHGLEQFRLLIEEGERLTVGRTDGPNCVGLASRLTTTASDAVSRTHVAFALVEGRVIVEDLGSRNGTVVRSAGLPGELRLRPKVRHVMGRRDTIALPSGITLEISGRSVPLGEESAHDGPDATALDDRVTRILVTRT